MKRHYCGGGNDEINGVVQPAIIRGLPESILLLAHEEYAAQGHSQSFERIQERGGFGVMEVIALLADHLERLKQ